MKTFLDLSLELELSSFEGERIDEVQGSIRADYSSDYRLVQKNIPGELDVNNKKTPGYRIMKTKRIKVGDKAASTNGLRGPDFSDAEALPSVAKREILDPPKFTKELNKQRRLQKLPKLPVEEAVKSNNVPNKSISIDPPFVLVLKRTNVRLFPNNIKIALYYSDKLNKYFSVPYGPGMDNQATIQSESVENFTESTLDFTKDFHLDFQDMFLKFLNVYESLNEKNRKVMTEMVSNDFNNIKEFIKGYYNE